mmetsp:Transcript_25683/g.58245  ORF Transcript_25683/g.58245 Transcript_25683/m.58245 type:complete len:84 (+) Transcript_25683:211-462(+)
MCASIYLADKPYINPFPKYAANAATPVTMDSSKKFRASPPIQSTIDTTIQNAQLCQLDNDRYWGTRRLTVSPSAIRTNQYQAV